MCFCAKVIPKITRGEIHKKEAVIARDSLLSFFSDWEKELATLDDVLFGDKPDSED
jgi:hypothetical protein